MVIGVVCLLLGVRETWDEGKKLMKKPNDFLNNLKNYNKDNMKEALLRKLRRYTNDPRFVPDNFRR